MIFYCNDNDEDNDDDNNDDDDNTYPSTAMDNKGPLRLRPSPGWFLDERQHLYYDDDDDDEHKLYDDHDDHGVDEDH